MLRTLIVPIALLAACSPPAQQEAAKTDDMNMAENAAPAAAGRHPPEGGRGARGGHPPPQGLGAPRRRRAPHQAGPPQAAAGIMTK